MNRVNCHQSSGLVVCSAVNIVLTLSKITLIAPNFNVGLTTPLFLSIKFFGLWCFVEFSNRDFTIYGQIEKLLLHLLFHVYFQEEIILA